MWLLAKERIITNMFRQGWARDNDVTCVLCGETDETIKHLFICCRVNSRVWMKMHHNLQMTGSAPQNLEDLRYKLQLTLSGKLGKEKHTQL